MKRRQFFKNTTLSAVGASLILPAQACTPTQTIINGQSKGKKAKNIIFMVSDGMSSGTLNMADVFRYKKEGKGSHWLDLYRKSTRKSGPYGYGICKLHHYRSCSSLFFLGWWSQSKKW